MDKERLIRVTAVVLVVLLAGLVPLAAQEGNKEKYRTKPQQSEIDAIRQVIERNIDITNNPDTAKMSLEKRIALGMQTHRPDSSYGSSDLPMYFATNSVPIIRGSDAYIRASELEYEAYKKKGYTFEIQVDEMQIFQEGNLALVIATPRGLVTSPDGEVMGGSPARWTIALEQATDGKWYIFHEHMSFYNDDGRSQKDLLDSLEKQVMSGE